MRIYTGCDFKDHDLASKGLIGSTVSDKRVHVVKTHQPTFGESVSYDRVVLLVRNPLDAIVSNFNLAITDSHFRDQKEHHPYLQYLFQYYQKFMMVIWVEF